MGAGCSRSATFSVIPGPSSSSARRFPGFRAILRALPRRFPCFQARGTLPPDVFQVPGALNFGNIGICSVSGTMASPDLQFPVVLGPSMGAGGSRSATFSLFSSPSSSPARRFPGFQQSCCAKCLYLYRFRHQGPSPPTIFMVLDPE